MNIFTRLLVIQFTISSALLLNCHIINTAHPCVPIVSWLFQTRTYNNGKEAQNIAHIVAKYAEEDTIFEAKSSSYYARAFKCGWISRGNVIIYNRDGNEIQRLKVNYPKAITFSPDGGLIIIMHIRRNPDPGFLFTGHLARVMEIKVLSLEDGIYTADYPSRLLGPCDISTHYMATWPNLFESTIKKFYVDKNGTLKVEVGRGITNDRDGSIINSLTEPQFIQTSNRELQEKRDNIRWWKKNIFACIPRWKLTRKENLCGERVERRKK